MASELKTFIMDIAASIWYKPGTFDELYARKIESVKFTNEHTFNTLLQSARIRGWIYERNNVWHCYKKTVIDVLIPNDYNIEVPVDTRSEFRKAFDRSVGKK